MDFKKMKGKFLLSQSEMHWDRSGNPVATKKRKIAGPSDGRYPNFFIYKNLRTLTKETEIVFATENRMIIVAREGEWERKKETSPVEARNYLG